MFEFKQIENITRRLGVPMQAFISTCTSVYRKPLTGMWQCLVEQVKNNTFAYLFCKLKFKMFFFFFLEKWWERN